MSSEVVLYTRLPKLGAPASQAPGMHPSAMCGVPLAEVDHSQSLQQAWYLHGLFANLTECLEDPPEVILGGHLRQFSRFG